MLKRTWLEQPQERPSFADIVQFFHQQNIKDSLTHADERDTFVGDAESACDSGYLELM